MDKKKAAATAAVAAAAVAGIVTGSVFDSPADLMPELDEEPLTEEEAAPSEEGRKGPSARIREWVLSLPAAVRMLVAVPLWCLGSVLLGALSVFWSGTAPLLSSLLNWVCLAAVLLGVFALSVKTAFPGMSFRRILRIQNILLLLGLSALLWAADLALPMVWEGYDLVSRTVWRVGAACLLAFTCCAELKRQGRQVLKAQQRALPPQRTAVEEEARRLAETVCGSMR